MEYVSLTFDETPRAALGSGLTKGHGVLLGLTLQHRQLNLKSQAIYSLNIPDTLEYMNAPNSGPPIRMRYKVRRLRKAAKSALDQMQTTMSRPRLSSCLWTGHWAFVGLESRLQGLEIVLTS